VALEGAPLASAPMSGPVFIASDVHLGAVPPERERAFLRWMEHAGGSASRVVINGDLFDFWFEYRNAIPRGHTRVLGELARLVDAGIPVDFMGGNHDWWGGDYLEGEVGVRFHRDPVVLELAGHRTLVAHGDGLGQGDLGYRALRRVLRGPATRWAFRWLHPDLGARVARAVSRTHERRDSPEEDRGRADALRNWAGEAFAADSSLDLVTLGHSHVPELSELTPGHFYLNSGDWIRNATYGVLEEGSPPRLERWES